MNEQELLISERNDLVSQLTSPHSVYGDWKLNKQQESILLGNEQPYTKEQMQEYGRKRAEIRIRINEIDEILQKME